MIEERTGPSDDRVEQAMGTLLRCGVVLAGLTVLVGGVLFLAQHGGEPAGHHDFHAVAPPLRSPGGILAQAARLDSRGVIQFGLLLLIATPVARVIFTVFAFLWQRDYLYVGFTLVVLAVLLFSLGTGLWGAAPTATP